MSYQAITDIIVNPSQLQDLQLSTTVKDSPKQTSVSFADILSSYTNEDISKSDSKPVQSESEERKLSETERKNPAEKAEETSENQVKKSEKEEDRSEKAVEKTDSRAKDAQKASEKADDDKKPAMAEKNTTAQTKNQAQIKSPAKAGEKTAKDLKSKKLSEKDFSRLEELTQKTELENDASKLAANLQKLVKEDENNQPKDLKADDSELEIKGLADSANQNAVNNLQNTENNNEASEFDFSGGEEKGRKTFALDKEGKITVEDQRTKLEGDANNQLADSKKSAIKSSEIKLTNDSTAVMSLELNPNAEADVLSLNTQTAASNGSNFQAMLSNQLSNVAPEFVKAGNLVLKDNNQGTINLVLHPDDLGNVKIHLSLDGKTLSGHITVATKEALQVFKDNAETLREAFIKNGFDAANFDVAMNNGGSFNQSSGFEGQDNGNNLFAKRAYGDSAASLSAELESILDNAEDISNYSVNIVA